MRCVVSLFSGCGGLDIGFKEQGFDVIYACDSDPAAVACYARNIDTRVFVRDVTSPEFHADIKAIGKCDVVLGGFPCQGFSKAGPKNAQDSRNALYIEMKNAVAALQPRIFIAENVDGLSQNYNGSFLKRIVADFKQIGYDVEYRIIDAVAYGVPQHRRRIFFVGTNQASKEGFQWPTATHQGKARNGEFKLSEFSSPGVMTLWQNSITSGQTPGKYVTIGDTIGDLISLENFVPDHSITRNWPKKYESIFRAIKPGQKLCNVRHARTSVYTWEIPEVFGTVTEDERIILETIAKHRRHKKYGDIPNGNPLSKEEIECLSGLKEIEQEIEDLLSKGYLKMKDEKYDLLGAMFCSGLFKRPYWNEPSPTVLTNFHNPRYFLHPLEDRPFSLRECARLQGFPDTFIFCSPDSQVNLISGYRLVGNAVPPPLSRCFASATLDFIMLENREAMQV